MEQLKPVGRISTSRRLPLLLVTEGVGDIEFLKRISRTLHVADDRLPDLGSLENLGQLIFIPIGGGEIAAWGARLSRLDNRRFQLHDRESWAEAARRRVAAAALKGPECVVRLTSKRALENISIRKPFMRPADRSSVWTTCATCRRRWPRRRSALKRATPGTADRSGRESASWPAPIAASAPRRSYR